ncbi:MAG: hypothetical protein WCD79_12055 [Chthoniobacteraceae bacterium]
MAKSLNTQLTKDSAEETVTSVKMPSLIAFVSSSRSDLIRVALLALFSVLLWCCFCNRWTVESWQTPLAYTSDPYKGDVLAGFSQVRAARDGHYFPLFFKNIPELGAPYGGNWNDFPQTSCLLFFIPGILARVIGIFAAFNLMVMIEHVLATIAFYVVCRLLKCSWVWSSAGALIFAFARFPFSHGAHHIDVTYCWHVPLCLLVSSWIISEDGIGFWEWRFIFALGVAFITGILNPYYTNMFAQFVLFGGLIQWWRRRDWRVALPAAALIGTATVAFLLINVNTFAYHFVHGPNPGALLRPYKWMEIYALKTVDLIIPPPDHRFPPFASWGLKHMGEVILSPGELPPSGYIGLVGLAALGWLVIVSIRRLLRREPLSYEALQIIWIMLYSDVGGINCFVGTLGFQLFRSTTRYSIFILCIVLMVAVRRLSVMKFSKTPVVYGVAIPIVLFALWDQLPPKVTAQDLQEISTQVDSDRNFTERMEQALPQGAMIFQLPIMDYPESPAPGVGSFDHFRPYLYSHHLRFAFGSDKGRPRDNWQQEFNGMSLNEIVSRLESYGFSAVYVNRSGFPDKGEQLEKAFKQIGRGEIIQSDLGDLFCVLLKPSAQPILPDGGLYH